MAAHPCARVPLDQTRLSPFGQFGLLLTRLRRDGHTRQPVSEAKHPHHLIEQGVLAHAPMALAARCPPIEQGGYSEGQTINAGSESSGTYSIDRCVCSPGSAAKDGLWRDASLYLVENKVRDTERGRRTKGKLNGGYKGRTVHQVPSVGVVIQLHASVSLL